MKNIETMTMQGTIGRKFIHKFRIDYVEDFEQKSIQFSHLDDAKKFAFKKDGVIYENLGKRFPEFQWVRIN